MKRLIVFFALFSLCVCSSAQTIHWITFFDTKDVKIGEAEVNTRALMYSHFINVVNAALAEKNYTADIHDYYDVATTPANCKRAIENLDITLEQNYENDIIVFYYSGHGTRPDVDKVDTNRHPFPQMCLGQNNDQYMIPLEWVHNELKKKGARLVISIASCCNSTDPNCSPKDKPVFDANLQSASLAQNQVDAIQKMFLEYRGDIIATEATPTEFGWVGPFFGGYFHIYGGGLVSTFEQYTGSRKYDLKEFFDILSSNITNEAMNHFKSLHPVVWCNVRRISEPLIDEERERPDEINVNDNNRPNLANNRTTDKNNELSNYFDYIADKKLTLSKRVDLANTLKSKCTGNTTVKILAQDTEFVVDKESIADFCDRISTSRLLLKVAPVDAKIVDNQITEIRVREYYKR